MTKQKLKSIPAATFKLTEFKAHKFKKITDKYKLKNNYDLLARLELLHVRVHSLAIMRKNKPRLNDVRYMLNKVSEKSMALSILLDWYLNDPNQLITDSYSLKMNLNNYRSILHLLEFDLLFWLSGQRGHIGYERGWVTKINLLKRYTIKVSSYLTFNDIHQVYYTPIIIHIHKLKRISSITKCLSQRSQLVAENIYIKKGRQIQYELYTAIEGLICIFIDGISSDLSVSFDQATEEPIGELFIFIIDCLKAMEIHHQSLEALFKMIVKTKNNLL